MRGIDYGNGQTNIDKETGIRFGVLPVNSLNWDALDEILQRGKDVGFEQFKQETVKTVRDAVLEALDFLPKHCAESLADRCAQAAETSSELGEGYESDECHYSFETEDTKLLLRGQYVWVLKSPHIVRCALCSPCCPGAGNLDEICDDGAETYGLDSSWLASPCQ